MTISPRSLQILLLFILSLAFVSNAKPLANTETTPDEEALMICPMVIFPCPHDCPDSCVYPGVDCPKAHPPSCPDNTSVNRPDHHQEDSCDNHFCILIFPECPPECPDSCAIDAPDPCCPNVGTAYCP